MTNQQDWLQVCLRSSWRPRSSLYEERPGCAPPALQKAHPPERVRQRVAGPGETRTENGIVSKTEGLSKHQCSGPLFSFSPWQEMRGIFSGASDRPEENDLETGPWGIA